MYILCTYMSVTYFLFTYMSVKVCTPDVQCTDGYIHFMKCTGIVEQCTYTDVSFWFSFLFALLPGLYAGSGCCQLSRLFKFKHTRLIGIGLSSLLLSTPCPCLPDKAGGWFRNCKLLPATCSASSVCAGVCRAGNSVHCACLNLHQMRPRPRCQRRPLGP